MNILNRHIKIALGGRYGARNVSVRSGTGTASSWVHADVRIQRPQDCYCTFNTAQCRICTERLTSAKTEAHNIAYAAQEKSGERFATYLTDDGIGQERDCFILQISFIIPKQADE